MPPRRKQTPAGSQQHPPTTNCRTCRRCRMKKVKCDGANPTCRACRIAQCECHYPKDGRKASRATRDELQALQRDIRMLQAHVNDRGHSVSVVESPSRSVSREDASPRQSPSLRKKIVPEEGRFHPYGLTSTLHRSPVQNVTINAQEPSENLTVSPLDDELAGAQLIANAALQKQHETIFCRGCLRPTGTCTVDFDGISPDTAIHLLSLHWNRQHHSYLITYRPAIMDSLLNGGPYVNKLLLNAIYFSSSFYSDRVAFRPDPNNSHSLGLRCYRRFKELLVDEIDRPSIPTATALLLCGASLVAYGEHSAGWVYCGAAYRMITDLGCHIHPAHLENRLGVKEAAVKEEVRKRLFWGAYMNDKFQALFLGRSPVLFSKDEKPMGNYLDMYEEMELWEPYVDASTMGTVVPKEYDALPAYSVSTGCCLLSLAEITAHTITSFYDTKAGSQSVDSLRESKTLLDERLNEWKYNLPERLRFNPDSDPTPPPHQITLHTTYWMLIILTERPFLHKGHLSHVLDETQTKGHERSLHAALMIRKLINTYRAVFSLRRAQYLIAYATYCAVLAILLHPDRNSNLLSETLSFLWTALLEFQQGCNRGLKEPIEILSRAMQQLDLPQIEGLNRGMSVNLLDQGGQSYELEFFEDADIEALEPLMHPQGVHNDPWDDADAANLDMSLYKTIFGLFPYIEP